MELILAFYDESLNALDLGVKIDKIVKMPVREKIGRFKYTAEADVDKSFDVILDDLRLEVQSLISNKEEE